jgi:4-hydroxythreonine-4-phosphate dehydrogenase
MANTIIKIGITIGDVNGIGPEVIIEALKDNRIFSDCTPIIYGSAKALSYYKKSLEDAEFSYQTIKHIDEAISKRINVINVWQEDTVIEPGKITQTAGKYAFSALEMATNDLASNKIDVLVTAPISKDAIQKADFKFPGHTEYLAHLSGESDALMFMISDTVKVAIVTSHIPLKEVATTISKDKIYAKIKALSNSLIKDFGIVRPKIAVLGLNPHAGENGTMGTEEKEIIIPAIQKAWSEKILAFGPYPADGFFGAANLNKYDAVLAMYHDQGLTVFKALAFDSGVNYTAGLPIVRTSPDHGTAFDIAGKGVASGQSMRNAIYWAIDIFKNRINYKEMNANPLKSYRSEVEKDKSDK